MSCNVGVNQRQSEDVESQGTCLETQTGINSEDMHVPGNPHVPAGSTCTHSSIGSSVLHSSAVKLPLERRLSVYSVDGMVEDQSGGSKP